MVPMEHQSSLAMCSLDTQLILRVITLATMLVIRLGTMLAIRLATMLAIRLATMLAIRLATMLASTLEATSTTQLEGSTSSSLPTRPPSTSTLASQASDSRLQTPRTEKLLLRATIALYGNRHLWKSNKR